MVQKIVQTTAVILVFALGGVASADVPGVKRAKLIGHGWDILASSPAEVIENAEAFDESGLDGIAVVVAGRKPNGETYNMRRVWQETGWTKEMFSEHLPYLKQFRDHRGLKDSLIMVWFAPRTRICWQDDAAWANFARNMGLMAGLAREGGLKGLVVDNEDYGNARQWRYDAKKDKSSYDEICELARRRGREIARATFGEYPDMSLMFFWLLSQCQDYFSEANPVAAVRERGDLWPAFVNGILDETPATAKLIDGNEDYWCQAADGDFFRQYWYLRNGVLAQVASENRAKYLSVLSIGVGHFLDVYTSRSREETCWYFGPAENGSRLSAFQHNLEQSLDVADDYVWIYGQDHALINWRKDACHASAGKDPRFDKVRKAGKYTWEDALPGFTDTLKMKRHAAAMAKAAFDADDRNGRAGDALPKGPWQFWQHPSNSHGTNGLDAQDRAGNAAEPSLVASNVAQGGFLKYVKVVPGQKFALGGWMKGTGGSISVSWKRKGESVHALLPIKAQFPATDSSEWRRGLISFCVPPGADTMNVAAWLHHNEGTGQVTKFSDIRLVEIK